MSYTPLQLGSTASSAEAVSRSLVKIDTMLSELFNITPGAIDWANFSNTILPSADSIYDLGSADKKWRSLYVSGNTIYIGDAALSITEDGNIQVNGTTISPSVNYEDLIGAPALAPVALSNSYNDLSNKPSIPTVPTTISSFTNDSGFLNTASVTALLTWNNISNKPGFAPVALSNNYNDLSNKPSFTGYATETFVTTAIGNLVSTAPAALDTLAELSAALGNDSNFSGTVTTSLSNRLRIDVNNQNLNTTQKNNAVTNLGLATVAVSGNYEDLTNTPTISLSQVNADWNAVSGVAQILNKPTLFSGSYVDLTNKPTIETLVPPQTNNSGRVLSTNGSAVFWSALSLTSLTGVAISSPTSGQVLKYDGVNWYNGVDLSGSGDGGALSNRTITAAATATIADGASENITVTGFKGYIIYKIQTSAAAWVRAYTSTAERTADQSRTITTDPTPGSGVVAEVITTGSQVVNMAPVTMGFSNEDTPDNNIPIRVTNRSGSAASITVTMTLVQIEA
jgi:hypothetical protein